jgi:hypothetical protein
MTPLNQQLTAHVIINAIDSKTWLNLEYADGTKTLVLFKSLSYPSNKKECLDVTLDMYTLVFNFSDQDVEEELLLKDWTFTVATAEDLEVLPQHLKPKELNNDPA